MCLEKQLMHPLHNHIIFGFVALIQKSLSFVSRSVLGCNSRLFLLMISKMQFWICFSGCSWPCSTKNHHIWIKWRTLQFWFLEIFHSKRYHFLFESINFEIRQIGRTAVLISPSNRHRFACKLCISVIHNNRWNQSEKRKWISWHSDLLHLNSIMLSRFVCFQFFNGYKFASVCSHC